MGEGLRATSNHQIDRQKWAELSFTEQMGNIGSEVSRAFKAKRNLKSDRLEGATNRALNLFDTTIESLGNDSPSQRHEVLYIKERFLFLLDSDSPGADAEALEDYFFQFAIKARNQC